ncbi:MAG TPA: hypothetical protein VH079_14415 [Terriglobales bacterium]|nr:hypothetical protein [Terriglobales bacterium]
MDTTGMRWFYHPDPLVDLAITPYLPRFHSVMDIRTISLDMFLTQANISDHHIGAGDEVFMTGLFTKFKGESKNLPIVRMGTVALISNERVPFGDDPDALIDAYLIEGRSIGGLSGSPAFVNETVQVAYDNPKVKSQLFYFAPGQTFFMGLVIGHWAVPPSRSLLEQEKVNMGISVVVPAWKIKELLFLPEHVEMRNEAEKLAFTKSGVPVRDTAFPKNESKEVFTSEDFEETLKKVSRKIEQPNKR